MDADGSGETPLTHNTEVSDSQISATWSPDGDQIAYVRFVPDCARPCLGHYILYPSEIYRMNSDSSNPTLLEDFGKGSEVWGLDWQARLSSKYPGSYRGISSRLTLKLSCRPQPSQNCGSVVSPSRSAGSSFHTIL
jgi:hypothetical protein